MRLKLARPLASVSARCASSVAKSGTSAARVSSPTSPGAAVLGSNGADRHSRRICVRVGVKPARRRAQHFGMFGGEVAKAPCLVEHARGRGIENIGRASRMDELEILSDEL